MGTFDFDPRAIAKLARSASRVVFPRWESPESDGNPGEVWERAIEAQIAATVTGRKPLYFEPWGNEISQRLARSYREALPDEVEVHVRDENLLIYRPEIVRPILDSDPEFYRRPNESDLDSIARVSSDSLNGELLGYGARRMDQRPAKIIRIFKAQKLLLYYFTSSSDDRLAEECAQERSLDFIQAFGWDDVGFAVDDAS